MATQERNRQIVAMRVNGTSLMAIARAFGLSFQRIAQVIQHELDRIPMPSVLEWRRLETERLEKIINDTNLVINSLQQARAEEAREMAEAIATQQPYKRKPGRPPWHAQAVYTEVLRKAHADLARLHGLNAPIRIQDERDPLRSIGGFDPKNIEHLTPEEQDVLAGLLGKLSGAVAKEPEVIDVESTPIPEEAATATTGVEVPAQLAIEPPKPIQPAPAPTRGASDSVVVVNLDDMEGGTGDPLITIQRG